MLNSEFLLAAYGDLRADQYGWVASFHEDPNQAVPASWLGKQYYGRPTQRAQIDNIPNNNNFFSVAVMAPIAGKPNLRRKERFYRLAVLVADDCMPQDLYSATSYAIETSPNKYQAGVFIDPLDLDAQNVFLVDLLMQKMAENEFIRADKSGNNLVRYVRLPVGTNTKMRDTGPWQVRTVNLDPDQRPYSLADAARCFGINLDFLKEAVPDLSLEDRVRKLQTKEVQTLDAAKAYAGLVNPAPEQRSYHDSLLRISASLVSAGAKPQAVVSHLQGLMVALQPDVEAMPEEYRRHEARLLEIPRMTFEANKKYAPPVGGERKIEDLILTPSRLAVMAGNVKWLVKQFIPADSVGVLFGPSGTFKSFVALDMGMHIANDQQWTGRKTAGGPVLYVAAEGGAGIYTRYQAWLEQKGFNQREDNFYTVITPLLLSLEEEVDYLASAIALLPRPPTLIFVDTLAQTFDGDENSSSDISDYLRLLNSRIRAIFGCTVIVIHHTGHNATERPRGSSAIIANTDFMLGCYRPDPERDFCHIEVQKQKNAERIKPVLFEMQKRKVGITDDGDEISSLVAVWREKDVHQAILDNVNTKREALIYKMFAEYGAVVNVDEMRDELHTHFGLKGDASRVALRNILKKLEATGYIKKGIGKEWRRI